MYLQCKHYCDGTLRPNGTHIPYFMAVRWVRGSRAGSEIATLTCEEIMNFNGRLRDVSAV